MSFTSASMLLIPSHVHLKCAHTDPRSGPRSRQPDEVFTADVAGEQGGADLFERPREILRILLIPSPTFGPVGRKFQITYRKPEHVSAGEEEAADRVPVLPEHRLKWNRHFGLQVLSFNILPTYT